MQSLRSPESSRGFRLVKWDDVTNEKDAPAAVRPTHSIQKLVMGEELLKEITSASKRNDAEQRIVMIQAVFEKIEHEHASNTK